MTKFGSYLVSGLMTMTMVSTLAFSTPVLAQSNSAQENLNAVGNAAGASQQNLLVVIGRVIQIILSLLGVLAVVYIIWGGFLWMNAGGDEGKIKTATKLIKNAVIGMVIIVLAYSIANFVLGSLTRVAT